MSSRINFYRRQGIFFIKIHSLLLILTVFGCSPATDFRENVSTEVFTEYFDRRIPVLMDRYDIPGLNIALLREGETVWTKAYGYADLSTGRRMTTDTYCRVESISKPVTAWGVMKLVETGQIDLDQPVRRYLKNWSFPDSEYSTGQITVRHLLSHHSGISLGTIGVIYEPGGAMPTLEEYLSDEAVLVQEPGHSFLYSNTGFNLLELMIKEVTARPFADFMQQEVLDPLGMQHSSFTWKATFDPPVPNGYRLNGEPVPPYVYPVQASGGLFSTVGDIATFVAAEMPAYSSPGRRVLNENSIHQLHEPEVEKPGLYRLVFDAYGLGHYIEELPNGARAISHGGQGTGWMTHFHAVPESGDGIIMLTNSQRSWPFFAYMLRDWADWRGFGAVGMEKIILGTHLLWGLIVLMGLAVLWQAWRLGAGLLSGRRRFVPLVRAGWGIRLAQFILAVSMLTVLLWSISQPYLFLSSIFPIASGWLGWASLALAGVLLGAAMLPKVEKET